MTTLYTAKKYAVPALEGHCVEFLTKHLRADNAFMLLTQVMKIHSVTVLKNYKAATIKVILVSCAEVLNYFFKIVEFQFCCSKQQQLWLAYFTDLTVVIGSAFCQGTSPWEKLLILSSGVIIQSNWDFLSGSIHFCWVSHDQCKWKSVLTFVLIFIKFAPISRSMLGQTDTLYETKDHNESILGLGSNRWFLRVLPDIY